MTVQTSEKMLYATCIDDFHKLKDLPGQEIVSASGKVCKVCEIFFIYKNTLLIIVKFYCFKNVFIIMLYMTV